MQPLHVYHAHSGSISSISVSPYTPVAHGTTNDGPQDENTSPQTPTSKATPTKSPRRPPLPATSSNAIHIATASMDGHVCVSNLIDARDVTLRNYARPVQAVALSPQFKNDRTYVSGGPAGNLVLTVGGRQGVSSDANTSTAAAASGWLGAIGIGSGSGKDSILHSGEGTIGCIKWSLSGKFVLWVNEYGIRIIRSNLHLDSSSSELAWKRLPKGHIPRPNRRIWGEMSAAWKPTAEWIDEKSLMDSSEQSGIPNGSVQQHAASANASDARPNRSAGPAKSKNQLFERIVVGWGDTAWVLHVFTNSSEKAKREDHVGRAEIAHQ